MPIRPALFTGLAVVALVILAGCAAPADPDAASGGEPADGSSSTAAGTTAECLLGRWTLDADDLAQQLKEMLAGNGLDVTAAQAAGTVTLDVTEGAMIYDSAVTFALTTNLGGSELVMTQAQDGVSRGAWTVDGDSIHFSSWENGLTFTTTANGPGGAIDLPIEVPAESFGASSSHVNCAGDSLTTAVEGGLFVNHWTRIG